MASEGRFRSLVENALELVAIVGAEGTFAYTSPSFRPTLGYAAGELVGTDAFSLIHPEDVERVWQEFAAGVQAEGATALVEYRYRHRDGSWRTLESVGVNMLSDPEVEGVVVWSRDVTARRALEEQVQNARRLDAIGQLAGGVAHDFNNVLLVVRGYAAILQDRLGVAPEARYAAEIVDAADHAAGLTRQLLAFGRRQTLQPELLDVNEIVRGTKSLLRRLLPPGVELVVRTSEAPAVVLADVSQIEQVLVNLAANAGDAVTRGGRVTIDVSRVELAGDTETSPPLGAGRYVAITVADTGNGIDPDVLAHVFEPFFTTKPQGEGNGLGLATVHGIVAQSGGGVTVDSVTGEGSVFRVYLPAVAGPVPGAAAPGHGTERVLLVEDDPQVRDLVAAILGGRGYDVTVAATPGEALALEAPFDLVVSDVVMPELSGYELAQQLRAAQPGLRSLFISGYARGLPSVGGELEAGVLLLRKPFTADELATTVRRVLDTPLPVEAPVS